MVHLAQLRGLVESQVMVPEGQEELSQQLNLSTEEIFHLLDLNQDGQLQPHEVCMFIFAMMSVRHLICGMLSVLFPLIVVQILTHSRVRDGIWLTLENLKDIYTGLDADKDGNGKEYTSVNEHAPMHDSYRINILHKMF